MGQNIPKLISCDESGFTGNDLLDKNQPYFAYASVDFTEEEASTLLTELRTKHKIQMPELKARILLKRNNGKAFVKELISRLNGRYILTVFEKRYCLAVNFFEYIYEPVLKQISSLFYGRNFHRFVANYIYHLIIASGADMDIIETEFQKFMRELDPLQAPSLFMPREKHAEELIEPVINFIKGYKQAILDDIQTLSEIEGLSRWVLELSFAALSSHLRSWGDKYEVISVICDESKPLQALAENFNPMIGRQKPEYTTVFNAHQKLTWNMSDPIKFVISTDFPTVQIADIIAGSVIQGLTKADNDIIEAVKPLIDNLHGESVISDLEIIDLKNKGAQENNLLLYGLGQCALEGRDPCSKETFIYLSQMISMMMKMGCYK